MLLLWLYALKNLFTRLFVFVSKLSLRMKTDFLGVAGILKVQGNCRYDLLRHNMPLHDSPRGNDYYSLKQGFGGRLAHHRENIRGKPNKKILPQR